MKVIIRKAYNSPHVRVYADIGGESRTKQSFRDECDINKIVARFQETGLITHVNHRQPQYLDVSEIGDYRSALDMVIRVQEAFAELPAVERARYNNDPAQYLDALATGLDGDDLGHADSEAKGLDEIDDGETPPQAEDG